MYHKRMRMPTTVICLMAIALSTSGCGSIHVFEESHIHIDKRAVIDNDDYTVSAVINLINTMQAMSEPKEEPLKGFEWDEKILKKYKGDQEDE